MGVLRLVCAADVDRVQDTDTSAEFEELLIVRSVMARQAGQQQVDQGSPLLLFLRELRNMAYWECRVHENALI